MALWLFGCAIVGFVFSGLAEWIIDRKPSGHPAPGEVLALVYFGFWLGVVAGLYVPR